MIQQHPPEDCFFFGYSRWGTRFMGWGVLLNLFITFLANISKAFDILSEFKAETSVFYNLKVFDKS